MEGQSNREGHIGIMSKFIEIPYCKELVREKSDYQHIQVFEAPQGYKIMTLDGIMQFSADYYRYHECLGIIPYLFCENAKKILILGGGDGLLAKELLRFRVREIHVVEIDPKVIEVSKEHLADLNNGSLEFCKIHNEDAFDFVSSRQEVYDLILADYTDPSFEPAKRLYTREHLQAIKVILKHKGTFAMSILEPLMCPKSFWSIVKTAIDVFKGFNIIPFRIYLPYMKCGQGFLMVTRNPLLHELPANLAFLNSGIMGDLSILGNDEYCRNEVPISTLENLYYANAIKLPEQEIDGEYEIELDEDKEDK